jgi:hypothetical protein
MAITVVGLVDSPREAQDIVRDLTSVCQCERADISVASRQGEHSLRQRESGGVAAGALKGLVMGAVIGAIAGFIASAASLAVPGFEAVIARGPAASIMVGAILGAVLGILIGALTGIERGEDDERSELQNMRRAGTLITVHAREDGEADCAVNVMRRHGAREIDKRSSDWNKQDWTERPIAMQEPSLRAVAEPPAGNPPAANEAGPRGYNRPMEDAAVASTPVAAPAHPTEGWITRKYTATYFGPERRTAANQQPYSGAERRQSA